MARIAGVDLPRTKRIEIGLTYIYGIGRKRSIDILTAAGVSTDWQEEILRQGVLQNHQLAVAGGGRGAGG